MATPLNTPKQKATCQSAANGTATKGHEIYVTLSPCVPCAKLIIQSGITAVHYDQLDMDQLVGLKLLELAGIPHNGPDENGKRPDTPVKGPMVR